MYGMTHFTFDAYSIISSMSLSVINTNFTYDFFRLACLTDPGTGKKYAGSSSFISMPLLQKLSNTYGNSSVSLCTYKLLPLVFFSEIFQDPFCVFVFSYCNVFHCEIAVISRTYETY